MSDSDHAHEAVERLEFDERKEADRSGFDRRSFLRRTALTGVAAGSVGTLLAACGSGASSSGSEAIFGSHPSYKFTFVNHVTTNPFFVPTQYGIQDACKLLGCSYTWTGSETSNVSQMVNAVNSAISAKADGIAVSLVDPTAFNAPVKSALSAGIPVLSYNADVEPPKNERLAYIGQNLEVSGEKMGEHIAELVPEGDVALFIATPGSLNIQPRIDGALKFLKTKSAIKTHTVATGAAVPQELTVIESYLAGLSPTAYLVPVSIKIPGSVVALAARGGAATTQFDFAGQIQDEKHAVVGNVRDNIQIKLNPAPGAPPAPTAAPAVSVGPTTPATAAPAAPIIVAPAITARKSFQYDAGFTLEPGKYRMKFVVRENITGKMGTFDTKFTVPDLSADTSGLKLSTVILSNQREPVTARGGHRRTLFAERGAGESDDCGRSQSGAQYQSCLPAQSESVRELRRIRRTARPCQYQEPAGEGHLESVQQEGHQDI